MSRFARIYDWNMTDEDRRRLAELRKMIDTSDVSACNVFL